jgi:hypothetical protein
MFASQNELVKNVDQRSQNRLIKGALCGMTLFLVWIDGLIIDVFVWIVAHKIT